MTFGGLCGHRFARAVGAVVAGVLLVPASATAVSASVTAVAVAGPVAQVPGPPPEGTGAMLPGFDLERFGYEASEFFLDGTADSYHGVGSLTNAAEWTVAPDGAPQPFRTRFQVFTPTSPHRFNGTVYVEWLNVSAQRDAAPDWAMTHVEMKRQGAIYVAVSAQAVGVAQARSEFPDRYGSLSHPGDSYSYAIFSQVGQALRDQAGAVFGAGLRPRQFIAAGESQSAGRMTTYVNAFGDDGVYDGYLIHSRGANGAPLRQAPLDAITAPSPTLVTDLDRPVFTFQSETDSRAPRQDDSANFRWWEVAGTSHIDTYSFAGIAASDYGDGPEPAQRMFDTMIDVVTGPSSVGSCQYGVNAGPHVPVLQAALRHLDAWVARGTPPPTAPRLATADGTATGELVLDEHGNATGGIRSPHLDVPIATLRGTGNLAAPPATFNFCVLFGTTTPFSAEKLAELYPNHGTFVFRWVRSLRAGVGDGYFLREDARWLAVAAATSDIGRRQRGGLGA